MCSRYLGGPLSVWSSIIILDSSDTQVLAGDGSHQKYLTEDLSEDSTYHLRHSTATTLILDIALGAPIPFLLHCPGENLPLGKLGSSLSGGGSREERRGAEAPQQLLPRPPPVVFLGFPWVDSYLCCHFSYSTRSMGLYYRIIILKIVPFPLT